MSVPHENTDLGELRDVFCRFPAVEVVYVFGSVAAGARKPDSDLDLAIEGDPGQLEAIRLDMLTELARRGFSRVDLVFLRQAPPVLAHEAVKHNHVVYAREDAEVGTVFSRTVRKFFDIRPYLSVQVRAYKKESIHG